MAKLEVFRKSFPYRALKFILGLALLPSALYFSMLELERTGFFNIDEIHLVIENTPDSPQYMQPWLKAVDEKLEKNRGKSLLKLDLQEVAQTLSQENWIETVSLSRRYPSQIQVFIKPKVVQTILRTSNGQYRPVVEDGTLLNPIDMRFVPDVPLLAGSEFEKKEGSRKKAIEALQQIPEEGSFSQKTISEIRYSARDGFWMTLINSGTQVKLGEEQIALKSARVSQVLDYASAQNLETRVIDANLSKKVLVRLRKGP